MKFKIKLREGGSFRTIKIEKEEGGGGSFKTSKIEGHRSRGYDDLWGLIFCTFWAHLNLSISSPMIGLPLGGPIGEFALSSVQMVRTGSHAFLKLGKLLVGLPCPPQWSVHMPLRYTRTHINNEKRRRRKYYIHPSCVVPLLIMLIMQVSAPFPFYLMSWIWKTPSMFCILLGGPLQVRSFHILQSHGWHAPSLTPHASSLCLRCRWLTGAAMLFLSL